MKKIYTNTELNTIEEKVVYALKGKIVEVVKEKNSQTFVVKDFILSADREKKLPVGFISENNVMYPFDSIETLIIVDYEVN